MQYDANYLTRLLYFLEYKILFYYGVEDYDENFKRSWIQVSSKLEEKYFKKKTFLSIEKQHGWYDSMDSIYVMILASKKHFSYYY